ncbi:hypothetical protein ACIBG5_20685 [Kribbella sp. NPDC050241]
MCEATRRMMALLRLLEGERAQSTAADDDVLLDTHFGVHSREFPFDRF